MQAINAGGRFAVASLSICLVLLATASPTYAINQVTIVNPDGGGMCVSCGQNQTSTTTGTATSGTAGNNSDGSGSTYDMNYNIPNDGQYYSGQLMTQVVLANGTVSVQTWSFDQWGNGVAGYATGWNSATIPLGGSASISISASTSSGTTFSAGFRVDNFGR